MQWLFLHTVTYQHKLRGAFRVKQIPPSVSTGPVTGPAGGQVFDSAVPQYATPGVDAGIGHPVYVAQITAVETSAPP